MSQRQPFEVGSREGGKPCAICGNPVPRGRLKYCGDKCAGLGHTQVRRSNELDGKCAGCRGPKDRSGRGVKLCSACHAMSEGMLADYERNRSARRIAAARKEKIEKGQRLVRMPLTETEKWCPRCQQYLPHQHFPKRDRSDGLAAYCKPCQRSYNRSRRLQIVFGISEEEYDLLLMCQDYACAICRGRPRKYMLSVDHDHKTGEIRGLLCSRCNHKLLGSANDDPERLRKAADYLEAFMPREVFGEPKYAPPFRKRGDA